MPRKEYDGDLQDKLEKEFTEVFEKVHPQIQEKLAQAAKLIDEACALAEEHGVPFRPKVAAPFRMSYIPDSLQEKFPDFDQDIWSQITGAYGGGDYTGWQQSQVC